MLKKMLIGILVILILPFVAYGLLYAYGTYIVTKGEYKQEQLDKKQEELGSSGNGYGGEVGFKIIDSKKKPKKYFWIDNNLILMMGKRHKDFKSFDHYVWNINTNEFEPVDMQGGVACFVNGFIYHFYDPDPLDKDNIPSHEQIRYYQSRMREEVDKWVIYDTKNINDIWSTPSENYDFKFNNKCKPWFALKDKVREESGINEHRFEYLDEWGWIIRTPAFGQENLDQLHPPMGIIDIDGSIYEEQIGKKIAGLPKVPKEVVKDLKVLYIPWLDKYWIAQRLLGHTDREKYLAFLDKNGKYHKVNWVKGWDKYDIIPLPSKKGLVWDGYDYREDEPSVYDLGGYIKNGGIHKFIRGIIEDLSMSPDGCRIAFNSRRSFNKGSFSLKVLDVCESKINGEVLKDAVY